MAAPAPIRPRLGVVLGAAVVVASAVGYVVVDLSGAIDEPTPGPIPPLAYGALVVLQAVILLLVRRFPRTVLVAVTAVDAAILASSGGELGIGALAVMLAAYQLVRWTEARQATVLIVLGATATLTAVIGTAALVGAGFPLGTALLAAAARLVLQTVLPAAAAEYLRGRARLAEALRERAVADERERRAAAERDLRAERTALARELHDIAGHHLSGVIVSAQAASALLDTDPTAARATLQALQQNARTALADLRRTVGLLREPGTEAAGVAAPVMAEIPTLVAAARDRGQDVDLEVTGAPVVLGALAETAAYRMVQESLANAARHAKGAACRVRVAWRATEVEITVANAAPDNPAGSAGGGYGIAGMRERAELVGGRLVTGPTPDGGWRNVLTLPVAGGGENP